jgi:hypothetical protein
MKPYLAGDRGLGPQLPRGRAHSPGTGFQPVKDSLKRLSHRDCFGSVARAFQPVIFLFPEGLGKEDDRLKSPIPRCQKESKNYCSGRAFSTFEAVREVLSSGQIVELVEHVAYYKIVVRILEAAAALSGNVRREGLNGAVRRSAS